MMPEPPKPTPPPKIDPNDNHSEHSQSSPGYFNIQNSDDLHIHTGANVDIQTGGTHMETINGATYIGICNNYGHYVTGDESRVVGGDYKNEIMGEHLWTTHGPEHKNYLKANSKFTAGLYSNVVLGGYNQMISPVKHELILGADIKTGKSKKINLNKDAWMHKSPVTNFKTPIFQVTSDHRCTIASKDDSRMSIIPDKIILKCGGSSITILKDGNIEITANGNLIIKCDNFVVNGSVMKATGSSLDINSGNATIH